MIDLKKTETKILEGHRIEDDEITYFLEKQDLNSLIKLANKIKKIYIKNNIHLCCALSIRTNGCLQNCRYCAQSSFWKTNVDGVQYKEPKKIFEFAKINDENKIKFIGLNSSTGYFCELNEKVRQNAYDIILKNTKLKICAAHGILKNVFEGNILKKAGVTRYEHNIQTSKSFFKNICTTHSYDEKINTIKYAKEAGLEVCSGVIIGMGESLKDRIDMALTLRKLKVNSVPINILKPMIGTPFYKNKISITKKEVLRTFAIFRIVLKDIDIIFGAGRSFMGKYMDMGFLAGLNGIVVGDMLTYKGETIKKDILTINNATIIKN